MVTTSHVGTTPLAQPFLHELVTCVRAPSTVLSAPDGQVRTGGVQGWLRHDIRQLSELVVTVGRPAPDGGSEAGPAAIPVGGGLLKAGRARFVAVSRWHGDPIADPTVRVERDRKLEADRLVERVCVVNDARTRQCVTVLVRAAADHAPLLSVRSGDQTAGQVEVHVGRHGATWRSAAGDTRLHAEPGPQNVAEVPGGVSLTWQVELEPRSSWSVLLEVSAHDIEPVALVPAEVPVALQVESSDARLQRLAHRGVQDLAGLVAAEAGSPRDAFATAGSPWYLTLFGRDSLWAARLSLPLGTDLALGTLRTLARRQGIRHDPVTGEQPGKILHEIRTGPDVTGHDLPPVYYGTVDATPLWISLLHDAWRWGLPDDDVRDLLPALHRALDWVLHWADADGDGLVEYFDRTGSGLANQGWKDSADSVLHADGSIAQAPIALCEAQAYAVRACLDGAALLDALGDDEVRARALRDHARMLCDRFRASYWVEDDYGRFPAIALDGAKRPVASATSNLGHLLGSGLLDADEESDVAMRLGQPDLDAGRGLRTLSADHPFFNPIGYHTGSVWPHDTAIAVLGLARSGFDDEAASLSRGLVEVSDAFGAQLPELFGGTSAIEPVVAYPASCQPQAWSAAAVVALLQAALGLEADVPAGTLTVAPRAAFAAWFPLAVRGLRVGGREVEIDVDAHGGVRVRGAEHLDVRTTARARRPGRPVVDAERIGA